MKKALAVLAFSLIFATSLFADVPKTINYQGRLRDTTNLPVADGQYMITFRLYDADTGGTKVWEESQLLNVKQGYFNTTLGNINTMTGAMFDKPLWLGLKVANEAEMTPRIALSTTPHAFNIADGIVTTAKLADNAVTTAKIADASITSAKLASALSSGQIADGAVTTGKIADGTISTCDIANNTITSAKLADGSIISNKIQDGTISTVDIGDRQITNAKIAQGADLPIGTILAWHKSLSGTPGLPSQYVECNGQVLNDSASPYNGQTLPNLNGEGRFLRGNASSGTMQSDAFQGHKHSASAYTTGAWTFPTGGAQSFEFLSINSSNPIDGGNGAPRTANETRPVNMSVVWIMKVK